VQEATDRGPGDEAGGAARGCAPVPLSVLDLATYNAGGTAAQALRTTTMLAQLTERLGFHRFWVAEHHSARGTACSSPAVLMAHLAARTERIRLGSGGVMLPNHPPLVVAEQFGTLAALHPGRIDLGVGRAALPNATGRALRSADSAGFADQVDELVGFLHHSFPVGHPYANVHAIPGRTSGGQDAGPLLWLLGTSERGGKLAGRLGLPFVAGYHLAPPLAESALTAYRESFTPSAFLDRPYVMVSVSVTTASAEAEADQLAYRELLQRGAAGGPAGVARHNLAPHVKEFARKRMRYMVCGAPESVRDELDGLVKRFAADELMLMSFVSDREPRLRMYQLIAEAYGMAAAAPAQESPAGNARERSLGRDVAFRGRP
jgi:luciferase family oxidoreductase group 1